MGDPDGDRPRYEGTAAELAAAIEPFVIKVKFLAYPEKLTSPVDKQVILAQSSLLKCLKDLQDNLSFSQASMLEAYKVIGESKNKVWQLPPDQLEDWAQTVAKRTRAMCRHLQQALCRNQVIPKLLHALPWLRPAAGAPEEPAAGAPEEPAAGAP